MTIILISVIILFFIEMLQQFDSKYNMPVKNWSCRRLKQCMLLKTTKFSVNHVSCVNLLKEICGSLLYIAVLAVS